MEFMIKNFNLEDNRRYLEDVLKVCYKQKSRIEKELKSRVINKIDGLIDYINIFLFDNNISEKAFYKISNVFNVMGYDMEYTVFVFINKDFIDRYKEELKEKIKSYCKVMDVSYSFIV